MKKFLSVSLMGILAAVLAGCSSFPWFSSCEKGSVNRKILINGKIYTEDTRKPWAQAVAIDGRNFAAVGTNEEVVRFAKFNFGEKYEVVDLGGKTVLPGLIDGHNHPAFASTVSWLVDGPRTEDKDELFENIRQAAKKYPKEVRPYFVYNGYVAKTFGGEGPDIKDLDKLIPDRPARFNDDSGHGCTYNTMALEMLKDENGVPHSGLRVGGQTFFKNSKGNYTGRAFQTAFNGDVGVFDAIGWYPPTCMDDSITPFLDCLRHYGDIGCFEAAAFSEGDIAYMSKLDREKRLCMYFDYSVMLYEMKGIEETIATARQWQERYESDHIRIRTVKFFGDGSSEAGDVLSLVPFANDPTGKNYGKCNFTFEEMRDVLVRLNKERLDLHVHMICDGTLRRMLDAVEAAQKICGDDWCIRVTLAHLECMHSDDAKRFKKLGVYADISAHWLGDVPMATREHLGDERADHLFDFSQFRKDKVSYGFSSDNMAMVEMQRMSLFLGMQIAMTGIEPGARFFTATDLKKYPNGRLPEGAKFTLEECIHACTWANAERMRILDKVGSIEVGKRACLTVLDKDIFTIPTKEIGSIDPVCTYFDGQEMHFPNPVKK